MSAQLAANEALHVAVIDAQSVLWRPTSNAGLWLKPVREDTKRGQFFGLVRFDPFTRSGLHQHQGVASSFVVSGGLTDYHGSIGLHQAGINVLGSTHDAIAYHDTILVSRLEGPVTYPVGSSISGVHSGSTHASFVNPDPDVPPEMNISVDALAILPTGIAGVGCQAIFDYQDTASLHRMAQLTIRPTTSFTFRTTALTEFWVRGGEIQINGQTAYANCFVCCAAQVDVEIVSPFGALLIAWAEGQERGGSNLFGF